MALLSASVYLILGVSTGTGPLVGPVNASLPSGKSGCSVTSSPRYMGIRRANSLVCLYAQRMMRRSPSLESEVSHEDLDGRWTIDLLIEVTWIVIKQCVRTSPRSYMRISRRYRIALVILQFHTVDVYQYFFYREVGHAEVFFPWNLWVGTDIPVNITVSSAVGMTVNKPTRRVIPLA